MIRSLILSLMLLQCVGCVSESEKSNPKVLRIMATSSVLADGGWGHWMADEFKKKTGTTIEWMEVSGSGALLAKLGMLRLRPDALPDAVLGVHASDVERLHQLEVLYDPKAWPEFPLASWTPGHIQEKRWLPYSLAIYTWMADLENLKKRSLPLPTSLHDFQKPQYKKQWIVEDARTSAPGAALKAWEKMENISLNKGTHAFAVSGSWSEAYPLFVEGKAPLVWSYLSSEAYHRTEEEKDSKQSRFRAVYLKEGAPIEWEGMLWTTHASECEKICREFEKWIVSETVQEQIPDKLWTYPARAVALPKSFREVKHPQKLFELGGS